MPNSSVIQSASNLVNNALQQLISYRTCHQLCRQSINQPTQQTVRLLCNTVQTDCNPKYRALQSVMIYKDDINTAKESGVTTFQSTKGIVFSYQYITNELEKFNLNLESCPKCGPAHQHFIDPKSHYDTLTEQGITWIQSSNAKMQSPFPTLKTYMHDPTKIKCKHPTDRPKGFIKVKRQCKKIEDHGEFMHIAKQPPSLILQ